MRTGRFATPILACLAAGVLLTGCGDSDPGGHASDTGEAGSSGDDAKTAEAIDLMDKGDVKDETGQTEVTVDARDNIFKPVYIEVSKGTTVRFVNEGRNRHDVVPVEEGQFAEIEPDAFEPDDEGTITFDEAGDYPYYCTLHGTPTTGMIGGVRVVE